MTLDELRALATVKDGQHLRFQPPYQQMSVSLDEAEFLYALVRALKPRNVLELGTGLGLSGRFIAEALLANGNKAKFISYEPDRDLLAKAVNLSNGLFEITSWKTRRTRADLVFIDSRQSDRRRDIRTWLTNGNTGLVLVHDAERQYGDLVSFGVGVYLPTANGMWLGRAK